MPGNEAASSVLRVKEEDGKENVWRHKRLCNEIVYSKEQLRRNCKIKNLRPTTSCRKVFLSSYLGDENCVVFFYCKAALIIRAIPNPDFQVR